MRYSELRREVFAAAFGVGVCIVAVPNAFGWTLEYNPPRAIKDGNLVFKVNYTNCPATLDPILDQAFAVWNGVPTSYLQVSKNGTTSTTAAQIVSGSNPDFAIVCDQTFAADTKADPNLTIAVAFSSSGADGQIGQGGLILNVQTTVFTDSTIDQQVMVLAHETGHIFGLGHSSDPKALMYFQARPNGSKPTIGQDDVDAITFLYPRNELISGQGKMFGCGSVRDVSAISGAKSLRPPDSGESIRGIALLFCFFWILWLFCQSLKLLPSRRI